MRHRFATVIHLILLLAFAFAGGQAASAQTAMGDVEIAALDSAGFPTVSMLVRVVDPANRPIPNLTSSQLEVRENGNTISTDQQLTLNELGDGNGVRVHFVLDAGFRITNEGESSRPLLTRAINVVNEFIRGHMIENLDVVAVSAAQRDGARTITDFSGDGQAVLDAVNGYQPPGSANIPPTPVGTPAPPVILPGSFSDPLEVVEDILDAMANAPDAAEQAQAIVLVTPGLERVDSGEVEALASAARDLGIPIYTVLTRSDPTSSSLVSLANGSNALYSTANPPEEIYRSLVELRRLYQIAYRSTANRSGTQQVEVLYDTGGGVLSDIATYDITIAPPSVTIESPARGETITRSSDVYTTDNSQISPTAYTVIALVTFPDGIARNLAGAQLFVNGASAGSVSNPGNRVEIIWDLTPYGTSQTEVSLQVEAQDELALVGSSEAQSVPIVVNVPPAPTPRVNPTDVFEIVEGIIPPTPTVACISPDPLCTSVEIPLRANLPLFTSGVSIAIAVAALIFAGVVYLKRGQIVAVGGRVGSAVTNFVERVTSRRVQATPKAFLVVLEGDVNIGRSLEVFGDTPLGRSKQYAELLFQQNDEESPISRLHCTIISHDGPFAIRDEDSANGTYLNGARLTPLVEEELHDGDEIELAQVERGGVKLLFQRAGEGIPDSARLTNPSAPSPFSVSPQAPSAGAPLDDFDTGDEF